VLQTTSLGGGAHALTATYGGDSSYKGSTSSPLTQNVQAQGTTTSLSSSPSPSHFGDEVVLTAVVTNTSGAAVTGTVEFLDGGSSIGTATLSGTQAIIITSALSVGTHFLTAHYQGTSDYAASTSTVVGHTVLPPLIATTTALSFSPTVPRLGDTVTLMAAATPASGGPASGSVEFFDGTASLGTGTLNGGQAGLNTRSLGLGSHTLTARYLGNDQFRTSDSPAVAVNILPAALATTTSLDSTALTPWCPGQSVTFTATVSSSGGTPSGTVAFQDGSTVLGTATLAEGMAVFPTNSLPAGGWSVRAVYGGDSTNQGSTSPAVSRQVIVESVALTSAPNPSTVGQAIDFKAAVTDSLRGTPTGNVTISETVGAISTIYGNSNLSNASAVIPVSSLEAGSHPFMYATYGGDATHCGATSPAYSQQVNTR
jgi:hypothetical protein